VKNGLSGLRSTLQGIRAAGMEPLGAYEDSAAAQKSGGYYIREVQGIRIAFVAFTKGMDGAGLPAGSEGCVNLLYTDYNSTYQKVDTAGIKAVLENVRKAKPDITIALLHWGSEFNNQVSATQEKIRDLLLENGVSAIIGTHSHYVQKTVFNKEKGTVVAYSLGDLLGNADKPGTDYSILLDLEITKEGATGRTRITGLAYTPVYIADETATGHGIRILRIREAITAYESNFINCVSDESYAAMVSALAKIESRVVWE
jgi:poly-gamma-glutamate synthesis protein (capsule biosynthesis protein)